MEPSIEIMDYVVALYDNVAVEEKREQLAAKINDIIIAMRVLGVIIDILKKKIIEVKVFPLDAYAILETEYAALGLNKYLDLKYVGGLAKLGFFRLNFVGFYEGTLLELLTSTLQNADELTDELIKTDIYCILINALVSFDATLDYFDITKQVMNYYNSLPEEDRKITFLPNSLATI